MAKGKLYKNNVHFSNLDRINWPSIQKYNNLSRKQSKYNKKLSLFQLPY